MKIQFIHFLNNTNIVSYASEWHSGQLKGVEWLLIMISGTFH